MMGKWIDWLTEGGFLETVLKAVAAALLGLFVWIIKKLIERKYFSKTDPLPTPPPPPGPVYITHNYFIGNIQKQYEGKHDWRIIQKENETLIANMKKDKGNDEK